MRGERVGLGLILMAIVGSLSWRSDQPIVENYVGRQIPTAMVARNLARGSGFLHPTLDTAPFPNRFLVEPPIYALMVSQVRQIFGFVWERAGRLTSALMTTITAGAIYGLARRREGPVVALVALGSFGLMPVTLRYGRAFQPDATMVGFVSLGLWGWDQYQATSRTRWAWLGGLALALGLALKVTAAWALIPFCLIVTRWPVWLRLAVGVAMLSSASLWYLSIWQDVEAGSHASSDNAALWFQTLAPTGWVRLATWDAVGRNLIGRAFTPVGFVLAALGWFFIRGQAEGSRDRLWLGWGVGVGLAILALGAKWHHGYYWLVVAPLVSIGIARLLVRVWDRGKMGQWVSVGLGSLYLAIAINQALPTWRTSDEWTTIRRSAARVATLVPVDSPSLLIAPEALLYYVDRPGLRLEFSPSAVQRAAGEWGGLIASEEATGHPLALVNFYRTQSVSDPKLRFQSSDHLTKINHRAGFVADVGSVVGDDRRTTWRAALRGAPGVAILIDEPDLILARLGEQP